jgi:hypothetical protein
MRTRVLGLGLLVLGALVGALGALPSGWTGQLHGVGGGDHLLAHGVLAAGVVLLLVGLSVLLRARPPGPAARLRLPSRATRSVAPPPPSAGSSAPGAAAPPPPGSAPLRHGCATAAPRKR